MRFSGRFRPSFTPFGANYGFPFLWTPLFFSKLRFFSEMQFFKNIFFFEWIFSTTFFSLRIFWGCRFDPEIGPLSIYEVFRAIPVLLHPRLEEISDFHFFINSFFFFRSWPPHITSEIAFRSEICSKQGEGVPESSWKPHKSKEDQFLLRNYTPKKFWAKKKSRKNPSKKNEKMSFLKNIIFFWVGFIFYFFESKKFFFSKLRFFQKWHFSKIFFSRMDFFDYFFSAQNFLGVQFRSGNWSSFDYGVFRAIPALLRTVWSKFLIWSEFHWRIGVAVD